MFSAASSMSASSKTMTGALPPSSRWVRLRSLAAAVGHLVAGPRRAGDRHHRRRRVRHDRPAGVAVAADDVEHAGRQELGGDLGHQQRSTTGVVSTGLEHDAVAGRERRRELPDRHHHRVVPRRDLADDADRLAPDVGGVAGHVLAGAAALEQPGGAGEEPDLVDAPAGSPRCGSARSACRCSRTRRR